MDQPDHKEKKNLFERNPRKTLVFTAAFFILIADVLARVIFDPTAQFLPVLQSILPSRFPAQPERRDAVG